MSSQLFIEDLIHEVGMAIADCQEDKLEVEALSLIESLKIQRAEILEIEERLNKLKKDVSATQKKGVVGWFNRFSSRPIFDPIKGVKGVKR